MEKSYHHGNLKEELIKKGIELINEVGEEKLSLRKLAIICGVSNSAPYTHFKSKDELLKEMSFYIFNLLKLELENTRKKYKNKENLLEMLGKTYVIFFLKNPKYYYFLSSRKDIEIDLSLKIDNNNMTALDILKEEVINKFSKLGMSNENMENKPNIKMVRIDERLIHGQGQLWIKSLGVNLAICANDAVSTDELQQTLMTTVLPKEVNVRFWTIQRTAEIIWKAAPHQTIFVVVSSPADALRLCELGFPMENVNVGNIHAAPGKDKVSQFIYLGEEDKQALRTMKEKFNVQFNTKTSPVTNDGAQTLEKLLEMIS